METLRTARNSIIATEDPRNRWRGSLEPPNSGNDQCYFVDLDCVVAQCAKRLKVGATAAFVVADSAYSGIVIPVGLILEEIFERHGYVMKKNHSISSDIR